MKYIIIGNGVAGTTAATAIRKTDPAAEISILTDEAYPFYSRIRLIDYLSGEVDEKKLVIHREDWYERNRIRLFLNSEVTGIDTGSGEVQTASGRLKYDRLLISTGCASFVPAIPGADREGVFTLRALKDAGEIRGYADRVDDILLIGGGVLGLEAGNALRKRGKRVSVVEFFPRLLPRQTDPDGSEILCDRMKEMGFTFYLGAKTKEIIGGTKVQAVLLEDGRRINTDMVIVSAGIKANLSLAKNAGILAGKGIIVNDRMETSVKGIYAAGDVTEHRGILYGIWPAAEKQGEVAGTDMAGGSALFEGITPSNTLKVAGIDLVSAGNIDAEGRCECIVQADREGHIYRKLVIENNCLSGCILLGSAEGRRKILKAIDEKRDIAAVKEELKKWNLNVL